VEGSRPEFFPTSGQLTMGDASENVDIATPTVARSRERSGGLVNVDHPMGMAGFDRSDGEKFSASMDVREFSEDLFPPMGANESGVVAVGSENEVTGNRNDEDRLLSDCDKMTVLDKGASAGVYAGDRLVTDLSSHQGSAASPIERARISGGGDRNFSVCDTAIYTERDRVRNGDARSGGNDEFANMDNHLTPDESVYWRGAASPSGNANNSASLAVSASDSLRAGRLWRDRPSDSMTADDCDTRVKIDEFGYIYDETDSDHTEDSEEFTHTSALHANQEVFAGKPDV